MNFRATSSKLFTALAVVVMACGMVACASIQQASEKYPAVSPEGLKLLPNTKLNAVYMRDGADFSGYDKVAILDCYVAFMKNWQRDQNNSTISTSSRITDSDVARMKMKMANQLKQAFTQALTAKGTVVVSEAGTGVLVLRPAIINLDVVAPDPLSSSQSVSFSNSGGEATLFLEVFDGVSGELMARVIDTEDMDSGTRMRNSVTNSMEADRMLQGWADRLANYLQQARNSGAAAK